nr:TolC family protein [Hoylesella enoeca]
MKRELVFMIVSMVAVRMFAQLSLTDCYQMAHDNYPTIKQYGLIAQSRDYDVSNASKGYWPRIKVGASADAFTDLLRLPPTLQAITGGEMKNRLLAADVQVNQLIYDGGGIAAGKRVVRARAEAESSAADVTLYDIRARVEQLFFGVLMLDAQIRRSKLLQDDLALGRKTVDGMLKGGVANQSDVDAVAVEQVKAEQRESGLRAARRAYLTMLGLFIGRELSDTTVLERPTDTTEPTAMIVQRPELTAFAARQRLIDAQRQSLHTQFRPKLAAFGLASYHSRMMHLMKNHVFAAGLTLSWDLAPFYTRRNDLRKLSVQQQQVDIDRETFLFNLGLQSASVNGTIQNLRETIAQDTRIIALRERIREKSMRRVQNGTETINEMLRDVNAVNEAQQQKDIHEIQLLEEIYKLKHIYNHE